MSRLPIQSVESAPAEAQDRLRAAAQANGFLPNLLGVLANAPTALETYQVVGAINGLLVTRANIMPFIATLATLLAASGSALLLSNQTSVPISSTWRR